MIYGILGLLILIASIIIYEKNRKRKRVRNKNKKTDGIIGATGGRSGSSNNGE
ncbi:hypothetical protein J2S74_005560 [Evansella vedderi]|uniref:LPXTG cell wall anchor domain-containing protein n=1 Tax=Evansella vedderi TaxID=38282 RepID=A0ABU0A4A7_9BACI|nr:hypothetical protein [Evansella vedderi]MDQ0258095.1 hypothetical protein [Evansella vedderi]